MSVFDRLVDADGCWLWTGGLNRGYGRTRSGAGSVYVHRWVWEFFNGPVPDGLSLDHLCRNTACANPEHLDPVPHRINVLRGQGPTAANAQKDTCDNGHQLDGQTATQRFCRTCMARFNREYRARIAARREGGLACADCGNRFNTVRGVAIHHRRIHRDEAA